MIRRQTAEPVASAIRVCCARKVFARRECRIRPTTFVIPNEAEGSRCGSFNVIFAGFPGIARNDEVDLVPQSRNVPVANKSRAHLAILDLTFVHPRHFEIEHAHSESLLTLISPTVTRADHDAGTGFLLASKIDHGVRDRWIALNRIGPGPEEQ